MNSNLIPFAKRNTTDKMVSVGMVPSGLACNCVCPDCGAPVEACRGPKRQYFRHAKNAQETYMCHNPLEISLHKAAEQLFKTGMDIWLPAQKIVIKDKYEKIITEDRLFHVDFVDVEPWLNGIIPDLVLYQGDEKIYVEIYVSHKVDSKKLNRLNERGIATLEIDLSSFTDFGGEHHELEDLKTLLEGRNDYKKWVYINRDAYLIYTRIKEADILKYAYENSGRFYIEFCPKNHNLNSAYSYLYYSYEKCDECRFCVSLDRDNQSLICSARAGFYITTDGEVVFDDAKDIEKEQKRRARQAEEEAELTRQEQEELEEYLNELAKESSEGDALPKQQSSVLTKSLSEKELQEELEKVRLRLPVVITDTPYIRVEREFFKEVSKREPFVWGVFEVSAKEYEALAVQLETPDTIVQDSQGRRWLKCKICNEIGPEGVFYTYQYNRGIHDRRYNPRCCDEYHLSLEKEQAQQRLTIEKRKQESLNTCPKCGDKLIQKYGPYGAYKKCSHCGFTKRGT